mgnify:FL=1
MRKHYAGLGILALTAGAVLLWQSNPKEESETSILKSDEIVDYDSLSDSRPQAFPREERKNPRQIKTSTQPGNLTQEEREEEAIKFAKIFQATQRDIASEKKEERIALSTPILDDIQRLQLTHGENLSLEVRQDSNGRLEGLEASIPLNDFVKGDINSLNSSIENDELKVEVVNKIL